MKVQVPNPSVSEEQLKAFWQAVQADTALQQKLQGLTELDAITAIAKDAGFNISADELKKAQSQLSELSEEQLEGVDGGGTTWDMSSASVRALRCETRTMTLSA